MKLKSTFALLSLGVIAALFFSLNSSPLALTKANALGSTTQTLFPFPTAVLPGQTVESPVINLDGFQTASVNVSITNVNPNVRRVIFFGPFPNGGFTAARTDVFDTTNIFLTVTPVHGPRMFVRITNNGTSSTNVQGFVYAAN